MHSVKRNTKMLLLLRILDVGMARFRKIWRRSPQFSFPPSPLPKSDVRDGPQEKLKALEVAKIARRKHRQADQQKRAEEERQHQRYIKIHAYEQKKVCGVGIAWMSILPYFLGCMDLSLADEIHAGPVLLGIILPGILKIHSIR